MNHQNDLISVIVPIYNVESYVLDMLISIQNQSYTNFEVIIYDDCSTDNTYDIVKDFCKNDNRFFIFKNTKNMKIAATLNSCLKKVSGNFIARCDGDDLMYPDRLQKQLDFLKLNKEIDLVGTSFNTIDENGKLIGSTIFPTGFQILKKIAEYKTPVAHIWLARKSLYDKIGDYRLSSVEDFDFILRVIKEGYKIDNIPNYFGMKIRIRENNTVSKYGLKQRLLFNYALDIFKGKKIFSSKSEMTIINKNKYRFLSYLHFLSDKISTFGSKKVIPIKILCYFLSSLVSFYKLQYFNRMLIANILLLKWKKLN